MIDRDEARAFADSPSTYFNGSWHAMQHLAPQRLVALQLEATRMRFEELGPQIPPLAALAGEQRIESIERIEDVAPLLFQHSVYKSYPISLLTSNRFTQLTRWLDRLTTHDLANVDVTHCESIDDWLDVLDEQTPVRVSHSSGTSGTMSFFPRAQAEYREMYAAVRCGLFQFSDPEDRESHEGEYFDLVWPLFRRGRGSLTRVPDLVMADIVGSEERLHVLRPGRLSSDGMFLAGRLAAAEARGEADSLEINPALIKRREEFLREQRELKDGIPHFITTLAPRLTGKRVWLWGGWGVLYDMARACLDEGLEGVFAPESLVTTGGGAKGFSVPDDWEELVTRFTGVSRLQHVYAMTEQTWLAKLCEHDRYHFEPWTVPFVLDPDDGHVLPTDRGEQTGRAAFFDLLPSTYWGGIVTGDEVSLDHRPCRCGRTTAHIARAVQRFTDKRGGDDDKISCAASDDAHARAMEFLTERLG
jgi:hypothetical protein